MLAVDLGPVEQGATPCELGDEVVLWGVSRHGTALPIDEVAQAAGTISYELMCAVAPRVPFLVDSGSH
jgi:alanine racemase